LPLAVRSAKGANDLPKINQRVPAAKAPAFGPVEKAMTERHTTVSLPTFCFTLKAQ
jgi:hypothetical protein